MTTATPQEVKKVENVKAQSQMAVAWKQFKRHRLAQIGGFFLILLYLMAIFAPVIAPDGLSNYSTDNITRFHPPTPIKFGPNGPYVEEYKLSLNMETFENEYKPTGKACPIKFGVRGASYKILGIIPGNWHLFGTDTEANPNCKVYLMGGEAMGRDLFTRIMYASQISLTIGVAATFISMLIGVTMGAMAAHFGGWVDSLIMRLVEVIASIPSLFLLILLRSAFPANTHPILLLYLIITMLAFIGWGGLARVTRGQLMSVRELDFVSAAKSLGASNGRIMFRHMLPTMTTFLIIDMSLAIPSFILSEAGLSFLGIGAVEPYVSWGSLLGQAQQGGFSSFTDRPWILIPGFFIVFTVMCFQLLGDGLRDAFDPRKRQ